MVKIRNKCSNLCTGAKRGSAYLAERTGVPGRDTAPDVQERSQEPRSKVQDSELLFSRLYKRLTGTRPYRKLVNISSAC
jgi:hypothetical protein